MAPKVSVVIIVHDRVQFIQEAIDSVLVSASNPLEYEVIVVKYANNNSINSILANNPVRVISCDEISPAEKLISGINASRGEIILFLEDDDVFLPGKADRIKNLFLDDPELSYVHNEYVTINENGLELHKPNSLVSNVIIRNENHDIHVRALAHILRKNLFFNLSCCSIRKEKISPFLDVLRKAPFSLDLAIFLLSVESGGKLLFPVGSLTGYRRHNSYSYDTSSLESFIKITIRTDQEYLKNLEDMKGFFSTRQITDVIDSYIDRYEATQLVISEGFQSMKKIRAALNLLYISMATGLTHFVKISLILLISAISPSFAIRLLYRYRQYSV